MVIPLDRLNEYNTEIERINIEQSISNKLVSIDAFVTHLRSGLAANKNISEYESSEESGAIFQAKLDIACDELARIRARWEGLLHNMDAPASAHLELYSDAEKQKLRDTDRVLDLLLRRDVRVSYRDEIKQRLREIFRGREHEGLRDTLRNKHLAIKNNRLFIALAIPAQKDVQQINPHIHEARISHGEHRTAS